MDWVFFKYGTRATLLLLLFLAFGAYGFSGMLLVLLTLACGWLSTFAVVAQEGDWK